MLIITGCGHSGTKFAAQLFKCKHEPRTKDFYAFAKSFQDKKFSKEYIKEHLTNKSRESNSLLVPHLKAIRELFPKATIIQLVRHPKLTVRSFMTAGGFKESEPWKNVEFGGKTRFEKCCHYWTEINEICRSFNLSFLRLEDLRGEKVNTLKHSFPYHEDWSKKQKQILNKICGEEMSFYGYQNLNS